MSSTAWTPVNESAAAWTPVAEPPAPSPKTTWQFFKETLPETHDVLKAFGLTREQMIAQNRYAGEHPWETIAKTATGLADPAANIIKSMLTEGGRGIKGAFSSDPMEQAMAGTHLASAVNPFAAPVIDAMSEQGLGTKEANAIGIPSAALLAAGEVTPRVVPPVLRTVGKAASVAGDIVDPDIVGLVSPRLAHAQRLAAKVGRVATKLGAPRTLSGNLSDLSSAESIGPLPNQVPSDDILGQMQRSISTVSPETPKPTGAPSYFETGATPKTNVPTTKLSGRMPLLQSLREFEIMNRAINEMNAQTGVGQEEILAEMNRPGGAWRGKESALPNMPPAKAASYLKSARNGLPDNAPDATVAEKAAFLKHQDEHLADLLQESLKRVNAARGK